MPREENEQEGGGVRSVIMWLQSVQNGGTRCRQRPRGWLRRTIPWRSEGCDFRSTEARGQRWNRLPHERVAHFDRVFYCGRQWTEAITIPANQDGVSPRHFRTPP